MVFSTLSTAKLYIIIGILILAVFILIIFLIFGGFGSSPKRVQLEFWGSFDDPYTFSEIIRNFKKSYPNISIKYRNIPFDNYEETVIDALAAGQGPDIWMIHSSWLPKHKDKLKPLPKELNYSLADFRKDFVDVAEKDLVDNGQIYALPLYVDTLALYYNKDLFNSAGISQPPKTWDEFIEDVKLLTKVDKNNNILKSGAAMGTARNINRSTDILSLLMLQNGTKMINDTKTAASFSRAVNGKLAGENALSFYTDFADPTKQVYTWNNQQFYSIDAFFTEKTAMMINYSHHIKTIREKIPRLNFAIAPLPQLDPEKRIDYASYFAPAVSASSKHPKEAWQFLLYLSSKQGATLYLNATQRPTARRDLIDLQKNDLDLGVFALQALTAKSWYQVDNTAIEKIFADMIEDVNLKRKSVREAIKTAEDRVTILMQKR